MCWNFPTFLLATKLDLHRDRQVSSENGLRASTDFRCIGFKEISTKETEADVDQVFAVALRHGWLFRQHREHAKHKNLTLYSPSTALTTSEASTKRDKSPGSKSLSLPVSGPLSPPGKNRGRLQSFGCDVADLDFASQQQRFKAKEAEEEQERDRPTSSVMSKCQTFFNSIKKVIAGDDDRKRKVHRLYLMERIKVENLALILLLQP